MTLLDPRSDPGLDLSAPLARANPVAKLGASTVVAFGLLLSIDLVTAGVALGLELLLLPLTGVRVRTVLRRGIVVFIGAVPAGIAAALFGTGGGRMLLDLGPLAVTTGSLESGLAISLRILAIGLPGIVLLTTTDPTDLADGLSQVLRLPSRFTLAALAATRLFGVMAADWRSMTLARRARGLGGDGPVGAVRSMFGRLFALLVLAIRRATTLATAMEARGFGAGDQRTWARQSRFGWGDGLVVAGSLVLVVLAIGAGVAAGTWEFLLT